MNKYNSHIKIKDCKNPFCGKKAGFCLNGYCSVKCMPEKLQQKEMFKRSKVIERRRQYKANLRRKIHKAAQDSGMEIKGNLEAVMISQGHWFDERRKEMQGFCQNCSKKIDINGQRWKWSISHIAPKALIPSVATHENNWIELCQQCHSEFDNTFDRAAAMPVFQEVKAKFQLFKHLIPPHELRKVNPHLL